MQRKKVFGSCKGNESQTLTPYYVTLGGKRRRATSVGRAGGPGFDPRPDQHLGP